MSTPTCPAGVAGGGGGIKFTFCHPENAAKNTFMVTRIFCHAEMVTFSCKLTRCHGNVCHVFDYIVVHIVTYVATIYHAFYIMRRAHILQQILSFLYLQIIMRTLLYSKVSTSQYFLAVYIYLFK
jgi:hypothetical protein